MQRRFRSCRQLFRIKLEIKIIHSYSYIYIYRGTIGFYFCLVIIVGTALHSSRDLLYLLQNVANFNWHVQLLNFWLGTLLKGTSLATTCICRQLPFLCVKKKEHSCFPHSNAACLLSHRTNGNKGSRLELKQVKQALEMPVNR